MPYAAGRVIHDADSHIMESQDWLASYADPGVRERLGRLHLEAAGSRAEQAINAALERQKDAQATAALATNVIRGAKGWSAYGAMSSQERKRALDDLGFSRQLVFTTFAGSQFSRSADPDVLYGGARALNRGIAEFCGDDKRMIAVGVVPLSDPERAKAETAEALRLGCGAIWIPAAPAGERSPGHPDLDPVWRLLEESGTPFMLHVGSGVKTMPEAYFNTGRPKPTDWLGGGENLRAKDFMALPFAPQMFLTALAFDGVFERFPKLRGGVIELGAGWVADFLRRLDHGWRSWRKTDPAIAALSMAPSDFIRRALRFTPFAREDAGLIIREGGPELYMFSSDFPHPEGTHDPIERFESSLGEVSEDVKDRFYRGNFEYMMSIA